MPLSNNVRKVTSENYPTDAGFIMTKGRMEKQGEHFCLHFLRGCAILLYTDECISPRAIVAQLDRAFGSDPEGQRFESSRSHQEKPRHIVPGLFFFVRPGGFEQHGPAQQGEQSAQWAVAQCAVPNR